MVEDFQLIEASMGMWEVTDENGNFYILCKLPHSKAAQVEQTLMDARKQKLRVDLALAGECYILVATLSEK